MSDARRRLPRFMTASGLILSATLVAAACSGASTPGAPSSPEVSSEPAASAAAPAGSVCDDLDALKASITALTKVDVVAGGTAALAAAVDDVKTAAEALRGRASTELSSAVDTFMTEIDALKTAVSQLGEGTPGSGLLAVGTAITGLASSAQALEADFKTACP